MLFSYYELCDAMRSRRPMTLCDVDGEVFTGIVNGIQIEDSSGNLWLVTMYVAGDVLPNRVMCVRTYPH